MTCLPPCPCPAHKIQLDLEKENSLQVQRYFTKALHKWTLRVGAVSFQPSLCGFTPERNMLFSQGKFAKPRRVWFPGSVSVVRGAGLS